MTAPPLKGHAATCVRKLRYAAEQPARVAAMEALGKRPHLERLYVYRCPACRGWHLTKNHNGLGAMVTADNPVHR